MARNSNEYLSNKLRELVSNIATKEHCNPLSDEPQRKVAEALVASGYDIEKVQRIVKKVKSPSKRGGFKNRSVWVLHMTCDKGHPYKVEYSNFLIGTRCKQCMKARYSEERREDISVIRTYVEKYGYQLLSETYTNSMTPIKLECPRSHEYRVTWSAFKNNGNRCPKCKTSRGESTIAFILGKYDIPFEKHKKTVINNRNHFFDFYLPVQDVYIEHHGEQHFINERSIKWVGLKKVIEQQRIDQEKRDHCASINRPLLETTFEDDPSVIHNKLIEFLAVEKKDIDLTLAEYYVEKLDVRELLRFYRWHTVEETAKEFNISKSQVIRYAKGTGAKIKPVKQVKDGEIIAVFDTQKEAVETVGYQINGTLKGRSKTAGGYNWYYMTQQEYEEWSGN